MMSKLGVLLTICLLLFPLAALPQDGDQPADQPAERMQNISPFKRKHWFNRAATCCYPEPDEPCDPICKLCC
uniref:Conotoxin n=1 Tax=Conus praecellens TaxID=128530 RepID=A0A291C2E3_CONPC|nr:conotoxin [Conus praecellens]